jgi:hypothetical protein
MRYLFKMVKEEKRRVECRRGGWEKRGELKDQDGGERGG